MMDNDSALVTTTRPDSNNKNESVYKVVLHIVESKLGDYLTQRVTLQISSTNFALIYL